MNEFSHFNLYGTLLEVKDAIARKSITELVATCGLLRDITNNLLEKSLDHDENIADILTDIDSINGAIEDIEKTIDELDGDISALENEVADINSNLENLKIIVNADNETETYEYTDETYGIKVTFYRRGKSVLMNLRTDNGLTADLPTFNQYYTVLTIPTQFRPAVDIVLARSIDVRYSVAITIGEKLNIGWSGTLHNLTYDSNNESLLYRPADMISTNLPKGLGIYYLESWITE